MKDQINLRGLALDVITEVMEHEAFSNQYLHAVLMKYRFLEKQERAFISRLCLGTIENAILLDVIIDRYSKTKVSKMKPVVRNVLRLSVYQIYFMEGVPDFSAVNEAVKLVKKRGLSGLGGFVNGVLRSILRDKKPLSEQDLKPYERYSLPDWLYEDWKDAYGEETVEAMAASFQMQDKTCIRTNRIKITPGDLKERLNKEGVEAEEAEGLDYAFFISGYDYLEGLSSFREGLFYVQDISSMMVAERAAVKADDHILDICAAPGGKSIHIAEKLALLKGSGTVEARDLTEKKAELIRENITRCGLDNISAKVWDARKTDETAIRSADVVIADLPCSGLGVIGKKPEIKYRINMDEEMELAALQRDILEASFDYVKPRGRLVYSTCTVDRWENEDNLTWFLSGHPDFSVVSSEQILPTEGKRDGFYIAVLEREA